MRIVPPMLAVLALAGCGQGYGGGSGEIVGYRWARTLGECGDTYLQFSRDSIEFVSEGRSVNQLPVRRIVREDSSRVMFVVETDSALAPGSIAPRGSADVAMVFKVDGDSIKLVGQGTPDSLHGMTARVRDYPSFVMRRCPASH
ncbi:hypothetical protein P6144_01530 [Sphingomonas sp. HITSZ_GF]|uniref:hypothetical protein n=1 Tax=Sphingomonas sp. HITSZ_GF TaxID=3037247 RepID=UPI00240E3A6F|nr:hypothetical protein [Sphingomonas sp. HITSZ_GF]MDG2532314.1 hypothetical protein [Sphingomonas sp. HITSZ_GF]